ncbi:MAG: cation:proton antiporter [Myxococcota bacterium]
MSEHAVDTRGWQQTFTAFRGLAAVVVVLGLTRLVREQPEIEETGPVFALGLLLFAGMAAGQLASLLRLPRLTGYLVAGVLCGPHGAGLLSHHDVTSLELINALALALIALQAGGEFTVEMIQRNWRSLAWASLAQLVVLGPALFLAFPLVAPRIPGLEGLGGVPLWAVGAVWSAVAISKSPAATLAVVAETRPKGPVTNYALGMVVLFDVAVLVLFAVAMMLAQTFLDPYASVSLGALRELGEALMSSVAAGTTFGLLIALWLWLVARERLLFLVTVAYGVTAFCRYFHYDTLLVFVIAGFIVQNVSRMGHHLMETAREASGAVMVVFFATAGAHLDIGVLRNAWQVALVLASLRVVFTCLACRAGHRWAKDPEVVRRYGHTSLISQAGVTIGLATVVAQELPDVGMSLSSLMIAVVAINEMVGPVVFKWGLGRAGELGKGEGAPGHAAH